MNSNKSRQFFDPNLMLKSRANTSKKLPVIN